MIVEPGAVVGRTPLVPLEIAKGGDLNFDILWWSDETRTVAMDVVDADAQVRTDDGDLVIDLAPTVSGNRIMVRVPAAATSAITHRGAAMWDLEVVAELSGERKKLARGPVLLLEEVTM